MPSGFPGSSCKLVRFAGLGCACGKLNSGVADKEQFHRARSRFQLHGHSGFCASWLGWRSFLLWHVPNMSMVLHYRHVLHAFMEICT